MGRKTLGMTETRSLLLHELLKSKAGGLTVDELRDRLAITRTAVQQHLTALERDGLVEVHGQRNTGGRPSRMYGLTEAGLERFPRRYETIAAGMLESVRETMGEEAVEGLMTHMADRLARSETGALEQLREPQRLEAVVRLMNELGYEASTTPDGKGIAAINCIYHKLARHTRAVCRYDERLLSKLVGHEVRLTHCMADGQQSCVFLRVDRSG